jgi:starch synthase (maltosyl-transferring)
MIRGDDVGNRDTADAPLWFCVACADLVHAEKKHNFLDVECGGRTIHQILLSIVNQITIGTGNGIRMDSESGLVFSPSHFTWMDTNYPAGTPRQGYPIEIQALWLAALSFISEIDSTENSKKYRSLADLVKRSILDLFWMDSSGYLSDCIHADFNEPARSGLQDDALRPNQLFAITLGALEDKTLIRRVLASCEELIVPGALRSLADRPVQLPLRIVHNGKELNDPIHPYWGEYREMKIPDENRPTTTVPHGHGFFRILRGLGERLWKWWQGNRSGLSFEQRRSHEPRVCRSNPGNT